MAGSLERMLAGAFLTALCCSGPVAWAQDLPRSRCYLDSCIRAEQTGAVTHALRYAEQAVKEATVEQDSIMLAAVMVRRSGIRQMIGDLSGALIDLHEALRIYERRSDAAGMATVFNAIGAIHHYDGDLEQAHEYYRRSLRIRTHIGGPSEIAILYGNIGSVLEEQGALDSAMVYHRKNLALRRQADDGDWVAVCHANLGECFDKLGRMDSAQHYLESSLAALQGADDAYRRSHVLGVLGAAYLHHDDPVRAIARCKEALKLAEELDNLPLKERCYDCLYKAYRSNGREAQALRALEAYNAARDSLFGEERAKENIRIELGYAFEREQLADSLARSAEQRGAEVAYQQRLADERDQKQAMLLGALAALLLSAGLWNRLRYMRRSRNLIQHERDRSDALLLNILPKPIADELKTTGRAQARDVENVSILFTDFHAFTEMCERMSAQELVGEIDTCYRAFDAIAARYGLEKIKTMGDSYMCAGGLPEAREGSARSTVFAALAMQRWLRERAQVRAEEGLPAFVMRAGIHTGAVVAGIVGETKFQYDVWGDTVNIAARIEVSCAVGEVNISEATYSVTQHDPDLTFIPRGRILAKGKGELEMYFVRKRFGWG